MCYVKALIDDEDEKHKYKYDIQMINAYYNAIFQRVKKIPDLDKFLSKNFKDSKSTEKRKQTPEEMFRVVQNLDAAFNAKKRAK